MEGDRGVRCNTEDDQTISFTTLKVFKDAIYPHKVCPDYSCNNVEQSSEYKILCYRCLALEYDMIKCTYPIIEHEPELYLQLRGMYIRACDIFYKYKHLMRDNNREDYQVLIDGIPFGYDDSRSLIRPIFGYNGIECLIVANSKPKIYDILHIMRLLDEYDEINNTYTLNPFIIYKLEEYEIERLMDSCVIENVVDKRNNYTHYKVYLSSIDRSMRVKSARK